MEEAGEFSGNINLIGKFVDSQKILALNPLCCLYIALDYLLSFLLHAFFLPF